MESIEQVKARLENIRGIEPLLTALRTIALSSQQTALKRLENADPYYAQLLQVQRLALAQALPRSGPRRRGRSVERARCGRCALLIVGSQRGLCGPFSSMVVAKAQQALGELQATDGEFTEVEVMVLGERTRREVHRLGLETTWARPLPVTSVPSLKMATELASEGLRRYQAGELDAFYVTYNHYLGAGRYEPRTTTLIPNVPPGSPQEEPGLPPIIETDIQSLRDRVTTQLIELSFYRVLLQSAAAEHSARFQLTEGASQNSQRLIEELTLTYHTARQEAVTGEMLELAVSAGLIGGEQP